MTSIPAEQDVPLPPWETIQAELADIPGEEGVVRRREGYAPYFLRMGRDVWIFEGCRFSHPQHIVLDDDVRINDGAIIYGSGGVWIGRHARIGPRLFIHSANHDIALSERAFFERGYVYDRVLIGDNCLVSANVSILPGAHLAAGTFVACGTVVVRGTYPDGCRIMGVPGKVTKSEAESPAEAPSIALFTPVQGQYRQAAELLVTSLGLPQVRAFSESEGVPGSVHTALLMGPEGWMPELADDLRIWRLADGDQSLAGEVRITLPETNDASQTIEIPAARNHVLVPASDPSRSKSDNACSLALYYAIKRLRKRRGRLLSAERVDLYLALFMLVLNDDPALREVIDVFTSLLPARTEQTTSAERRACKSFAQPDATPTAAPAVAEAIIELAHASDSVRQAALKGTVGQFSDRTYLVCPELLPALALLHKENSGETLIEHIRSLIPRATKAMQLTHFGLTAAILGHEDLLLQCEDRLYTAEFFDEQRMLVRSTVGAVASCYSPALAAMLMIGQKTRESELTTVRLEEVREERFNWSLFEGDGPDWTLRAQMHSGLLVDADRRLISRSLLENWLNCLRIPAMEHAQYELTADNYQPLATRIEAVWMSVFRHMQHAANEPLIRVRPWPDPWHAAFSVRYDIDRPVSARQVEEIVQLQARRLNAACASWYAIPSTPFGAQLTEPLPRSLQEVGVHALSAHDEVAARGVTHHSSPNSEYWQGQTTIETLEHSGAAYGEMLAGQLSQPRPAWIGDHNDGRPTSIWLTPIHFPLEGATDDNDLTYFDRRLDDFRQLLADGGHVIVGSHPDLDQDLLRQLLDREDLTDVWCATVGMVVDRCTKLMSYGAVSAVSSAQNSVDLIARHTIADVRIEVDAPENGTRAFCTQFNAGVPRTITWERT